MSALPPDGSFEKEFGYVKRNCLEPRHEMRRATDLIVPAENSNAVNYLEIRAIGVKSLVNEIENGKVTGGLKVSNRALKQRGFLLLRQGRVYGVLYGSKTDPTPKPSADAIYDVVAQMNNAQSSAMMFSLDERIVAPLASLFVGFPVERHDDYSAVDYLEYIRNWLNEKSGTATLAVSTSGRYPATTLAFIDKGEFIGYYNPDDVAFKTDIESFRELLKTAPKAVLEVSILPPEFYTSNYEFGFTLSSFF